MVVFGPNEFAARIVPAVAALGLVLITGWFGTRMGSRDTGIVAALLLTASPGTFALARYAILDTLFTVFLFGGAAFLAVAALEGRSRLQWAGYAAIAWAVMVKGPLAFVLCGLTFLLTIACCADVRRRLLGLRWFIGLILAIVVASPWFIYMYFRFREGFVNGYILDENLRLYASSRFANQPNFYFYFRILAAGLLPWTGMLIGRLLDDIRAVIKREPIDGLEVMLWAWVAAIVGFFMFSTFKLDHYVYPAAPALCLLLARAYFDLRAARLSPRHTCTRVGAHLVGPLVAAIGIGCGYFLIARLELPRLAAAVPIALTLAGALPMALTNVRGGLPPRAPWIVLSALLITYLGLVAFVMPALEQRKVVDDVARVMTRQSTGGERVATYRMDRWNPAFRFYAGRHVTFLNEPAEARAFVDAPQPFYCLMRRPAFDEFVAHGVPLRIVDRERGMWATSGRVLWRKQITLTEFVLAARSQ
jgi:4-amino-4-deoxy-L-arabinose transferase-like glycosyltransferase